MKIFSRILLTALLLLPLSAHGQIADGTTLCTNAINGRLAQEQRIYRSMLFGRNRATDERVNAARYDIDGNPWLKTAANKWVTTTAGKTVTWTDAQMDLQTEWEGLADNTANVSWKTQRRGIFETKGALTSELVPSLTQSFRALQCRTAAVCETVRLSLQNSPTDAQGFLTVETPGCAPLRMKPITSCLREGEDTSSVIPGQTVLDYAVRLHCEPMSEQLLEREQDLLKMSVTYDAAYRSLLQFTGQFDDLSTSLLGDFLTPIRQSMALLSELSRVPCFLSQCNE